MKSDIEIAQSIELKPIEQIAHQIGLCGDDLILHGKQIAKVPLGIIDRLADHPDGKLILVTAATPPPKGAGKTTTTIGLVQSLRRIGQNAMVAIREPSVGPDPQVVTQERSLLLRIAELAVDTAEHAIGPRQLGVEHQGRP